MKKKKVGIIGCGAIGSFLAGKILGEFSHETELVYLCDRSHEKAVDLEKKLHKRVPIVDLETLVRRSDFVIEAASPVVASQVAPEILKSSFKGALIMSVGGLLGIPWPKETQKASRLWIPSGALCGVDGLLAAREAGVSKVTLITRKPPVGLDSAPYFKNHPFPKLSGVQEVCVFKGNARQAVKFFPQNINVAAMLSLAGLGADKTRVEIWTSKSYHFNQHEVRIQGKSGTLQTISTNVPSPENPKTSALAMYAAVATLRKIFCRIRIGT